MTTVFDAGDFDRLDRERRLVAQSPRQILQEDRSPVEEIQEPMMVDEKSGMIDEEPMNEFDMMIAGLIAALKKASFQ